MKKSLVFVLLCVCLLSVAPSAQAGGVQALDSNRFALISSWWDALVSYFDLGIGDLGYAAASSSAPVEDPEVWPRSGMCIDPNGRPYPAPCVETP